MNAAKNALEGRRLKKTPLLLSHNSERLLQHNKPHSHKTMVRETMALETWESSFHR